VNLFNESLIIGHNLALFEVIVYETAIYNLLDFYLRFYIKIFTILRLQIVITIFILNTLLCINKNFVFELFTAFFSRHSIVLYNNLCDHNIG